MGGIRIKKPRNLTGGQIGLAVALGVISGIYIFRPYYTEGSEIKPKTKVE